MFYQRLIFATVSLLVLLCTLAGCGFSVEPPVAPERPVSVFLARQGIHTSLLLPREDGSIAHYSFSRWDWAALDRDRFYNAPFAVLWPGAGTLGTRSIDGPCTFDRLTSCSSLWIETPSLDELYEIPVGAEQCRRVLAALDERWNRSSHTATFNAKRGMNYVRDPAKYSLAHTCNTETAQWLRELGCTVTGMAMTSDVSVRPLPGSDPATARHRVGTLPDLSAAPRVGPDTAAQAGF